MMRSWSCLCALLLLSMCGCGVPRVVSQQADGAGASRSQHSTQQLQELSSAPRRKSGVPFLDKLSDAAIERTTYNVRYDSTYYVLSYPGGDPPAEVGVCTDEVIRSYRKLGVDLQKEVHEDMQSNFALYPRKWGLAKPDANIDHRRVPNLSVFFERKGAALPLSTRAADYAPGDVVTWDLGGGLTHIGIVVGIPSPADPERLLVVHNIGAGPQMEDVLFNWKMTGHYRYTGAASPPETR